MATLTPAEPRERMVVLDVLRGLALLGVLLGNTQRLYSGMFAGTLQGYQMTELDIAASWFIALLIQSKAQTLLTFLFGFGFAAQLLRARERGEPVIGMYVRRLLAMLAFGMLHIGLVWWGDVLWTYAVAGFVLLAFHRVSNRTRVIAAALLVFVPGAIMSLPGMWARASSLLYPSDAWPIYTRDLLAAMRGDDHGELLWQQIRFFPLFSAAGIYSYQPWLVGRFLLGQVAGSLRWFDRDGADHLAVFKRILFWGGFLGAAGLVFSVFQVLGLTRSAEQTVVREILLSVFRELNYLGLAAFYLSATVLMFQRGRWRQLLSAVAPAGQMPLTVYISQSVIMTFLLYGWGLGWNDWLSPAGYVGLSFAVFAVQVLACTLWLRSFRFGPLEWLWRAVVYWRFPPMRLSVTRT
ncbi:MAG: DUF418 domain-containing protein [Kofleriaceae bacterium]